MRFFFKKKEKINGLCDEKVKTASYRSSSRTRPLPTLHSRTKGCGAQMGGEVAVAVAKEDEVS
jgi:hypothetical protein